MDTLYSLFISNPVCPERQACQWISSENAGHPIEIVLERPVSLTFQSKLNSSDVVQSALSMTIPT